MRRLATSRLPFPTATCIGVSPSAFWRGGESYRESDALALLIWPRGILMLRVSDLFTVKLTKATEAAGCSEEWKLMLVMTANRLTYLRATGKTSMSIVRLHAEKEEEVSTLLKKLGQ